MLFPDPSSLTQLIQKRRSVFPPVYTDTPIAEEHIHTILANANWAPTHKHTEPWRFRVIQGKALHELGTLLADAYRDRTPAADFSEKKYEKSLKKAAKSDTVIAICMQRDPQERIPEWEEIAAVACAVQNMWLTCTALGIGSYWSSPKPILNESDFLRLQPRERCLGLFYMGHYEIDLSEGKRGDWREKVQWL